MTLRELLAGSELLEVRGPLDGTVTGLAYDSRAVRERHLFFALAGRHANGASYLDAAFGAGAAGAVVEAGADATHRPLIEVAEPRRTLAECAGRWHGNPSRALTMLGVTGTNGKTTTTWMLESIFRAAGRSAGVIGTTGVRFAGMSRPSAFTTPESPELQALLAEMRDAGVEAVAMEVSSHALAQRRAYGIAFDGVVFTNLTQDHLDYHGTMDAYLDAKLMLFDGRNGGSDKRRVAIVNADDPAAARVIAASERAGARVCTFGANPEALAAAADLQVERIDPRADGLALRVRSTPHSLASPPARGPRTGTEFQVRLPLLGRYNASNAAAAMTAASALGIERDAIVRGLERMPAVPGRLERVGGDHGPAVVVDYAHTPDALARSLQAVREHTRGQLRLVFGCGGDRDAAKRPLMGRLAAELADRVWITNDNPRSEDPAAIAAAVLAGARAAGGGTPLLVELDRRAAIAAALADAVPHDVVRIAGKGHETTQQIGDRMLPFDDRVVARELLAARASGGAP